MELPLKLHIFTSFISCIKVYAQVAQWMQHPGLQVLRSAAHYWPLDDVSGIHELWDQIGKRPGHVNGSNITLRIHNHTVLTSSHNSSYVYTNDSAFTNISATVDIVEGMVNKGIFLNGDNGGTFLHFGNYQNTCISDPMMCGPEGITFSFFWKNHETESRFAVASGGKVISNGFSVFTNPYRGYVEFYTRGNNHRWKADIKVPGPFWTHILFTWTKTKGLDVYINGTLKARDEAGSVSENYGDPYPDLVIGTGNGKAYGHYVTGAFDEFIIWERALSPNEILLYYNAATGQDVIPTTTPSVSKEMVSTSPTVRADEVSPPEVRGVEVQSQTDQDTMPVLDFLHELPNRTISHSTANNLTQAFLKSVEEVLSSPGMPEQQSSSVVGGLIETVDRVMEHMVTNLEPGPKTLVSVGGTSFVADYSLMKFPQNFNLQNYRFPVQGKNYISVPGEAFAMQSQTTIVGLFYHNMHKYYKEFSPFKTRINEATDFKDHKIQVASNLISLKVEPSPALSVNLSGSPLIKIVLTHTLISKEMPSQPSNGAMCSSLEDHTNQISKEMPSQPADVAMCSSLGDHTDQISKEMPSQPADVAMCSSLEDHNNQISKEMPSQPADVAMCSSLGDHTDQISKEMPSQPSNGAMCSSLEDHNDQISKEMPSQPADVAMCSSLGDHTDQISKEMPSQPADVAMCSSLEDHNNQISKEMPSQPADVAMCSSLGDHTDQISKEMPSQPSNGAMCSSLEDHNDQISKEMPSQPADVAMCSSLGDHTDQISKEMPSQPADVAMCSSLEDHNNQISKEMPSQPSNGAMCSSLEDHTDQISKEMPSQPADVAMCSSLEDHTDQISKEMPSQPSNGAMCSSLEDHTDQISKEMPSQPSIGAMCSSLGDHTDQTKEQQDKVINQSNKVFLYCAFLDYSSKEGVWSNEGCVRSEGNMSYSVCLCNHLTNFAILMQVVPIELTTGHRVALSTIGYVGCSISIFCLAITLVTFAVLSSVSTIRNQRYHIHANLSFAILVAEILLLISARFDPGTLSCKVMAVLLHFFFLSAFAWMLVEGLHLYSMVVKVFGSEGSKHFYYYGIGWGSPLLICVVSMTSALDSYGEVDNCWLSLKNGAIWAFVAPALFVIVVNIGILISVTRIISRISGENYKVHGDANAVKLTVKAVAVLLPILGISWIFGVLAVNTHSLVFLYIFAIFNSLQGFFVFLFHCLLNSEVRAAFKHKTKVWSLTSSSIRNINVKPFHSDFMNGNKDGVIPTKMNTWDKSDNSANRIDLSAV